MEGRNSFGYLHQIQIMAAKKKNNYWLFRVNKIEF
jgi:hypothetical protein